MICKQCGTENNNGAKFCKACGSKLEQEVQAAPVQEEKPIFCAECGTQNAGTAAFCKNCGAQLRPSIGQAVGASIPPAFKNAVAEDSAVRKGFSKIPNMFKMSFSNPIKAIREAEGDDSFWIVTLMISLIKALIIALIIALKWSSTFGEYGEMATRYFGISTPGLFFTLLLTSVLLDAAVIFITFGIGKAFKGVIELKNYMGAYIPAAIISGCGSLIVVLIFVLFSSGANFPIMTTMIIAGVFFLWYVLLLWKAFEITMRIDEKISLYAFIIALALSIVADAIISKVITQMAFGEIIDELRKYL